jgi:hypothetical protein
MLKVRERKRGPGALLGIVLGLAVLLAAHALESINGGRGDFPLTDKVRSGRGSRGLTLAFITPTMWGTSALRHPATPPPSPSSL